MAWGLRAISDPTHSPHAIDNTRVEPCKATHRKRLQYEVFGQLGPLGGDLHAAHHTAAVPGKLQCLLLPVGAVLKVEGRDDLEACVIMLSG